MVQDPPSEWNKGSTQRAHHDVGLATGMFCMLAATIVLLWRQNPLLFVATLIEALVALRLWHERYDTVFVLVLAILGTCAEIVFVQCGVWRYGNPTLIGIPIWFPLAFGTAGLACARLVASLTLLWGSWNHRQPSDR